MRLYLIAGDKTLGWAELEITVTRPSAAQKSLMPMFHPQILSLHRSRDRTKPPPPTPSSPGFQTMLQTGSSPGVQVELAWGVVL